MTNKIKLFFIFLTAFAVISVFSFFDVFRGVRSALLDNTPKELPALPTDTDQDGLSDADESYWDTDFNKPDTDGDGFLDGEEVASHHDPTLPAPDDNLLDLNLTTKFASVTLGGLVEGSLKLDSPLYEKSIDDLSLAVVDDGLKTLISFAEIKNLNIINSTKETQEQYVRDLEILWEQFFKGVGEELKSIETKLELSNDGGLSNTKYVSYFISKRDEFNNIAEKWQALKVPDKWQTEHLEFLKLAQELGKSNEAIARGEDDPVKAVIAFNLFVGLIEKIPDIVQLYSERAKSEGITTNLF